jgi:hypothetical protein
MGGFSLVGTFLEQFLPDSVKYYQLIQAEGIIVNSSL